MVTYQDRKIPATNPMRAMPLSRGAQRASDDQVLQDCKNYNPFRGRCARSPLDNTNGARPRERERFTPQRHRARPVPYALAYVSWRRPTCHHMSTAIGPRTDRTEGESEVQATGRPKVLVILRCSNRRKQAAQVRCEAGQTRKEKRPQCGRFSCISGQGLCCLNASKRSVFRVLPTPGRGPSCPTGSTELPRC